MFDNRRKQAQVPALDERRADPLKREAFSQRDRSKRVGTTAVEAKSVSKLNHADASFGRLI